MVAKNEKQALTNTKIEAPDGALHTYVARPSGEGLKPGVVVIHDALGMSHDICAQADWLAREGYLAASPDLFHGRTVFGCMRSVIRDFSRGKGPFFDRVEAVRQWLLEQPECSGRVGVIGFCFGGGFALMLAPNRGFSAASVNYGGLPKKADEYLQQSCPIVASYGAKDRTLRGTAEKLQTILSNAGVQHDIKEYPDTDHAFMNNHENDKIPFFIKVIAFVFGGGGYHPESTEDSRRRIVAFFNQHLREGT